MNTIAIKSIFSAAALTLAAGISMNATAEQEVGETLVQGESVHSQAVSFSRAELATEEGRSAVEHRVREAAEDVCGPMDYHRAGGLAGVVESKECYNNAVAQAMSQIDATQVASVSH